MTESSAETAPKAAKELLALDPEQEAEFKSKVREARRKNKKATAEQKSAKVGLFTWSEAPCEEMGNNFCSKVTRCHLASLILVLSKLFCEPSRATVDFMPQTAKTVEDICCVSSKHDLNT